MTTWQVYLSGAWLVRNQNVFEVGVIIITRGMFVGVSWRRDDFVAFVDLIQLVGDKGVPFVT